MKRLIIPLIVILLTGCASQRHSIEYLTTRISKLEVENDACRDSVLTIRKLATDIIAQDNEKIKIMGAVIVDFIEVTEKSIADSILEKHNMRYDRTDGEE